MVNIIYTTPQKVNRVCTKISRAHKKEASRKIQVSLIIHASRMILFLASMVRIAASSLRSAPVTVSSSPNVKTPLALSHSVKSSARCTAVMPDDTRQHSMSFSNLASGERVKAVLSG